MAFLRRVQMKEFEENARIRTRSGAGLAEARRRAHENAQEAAKNERKLRPSCFCQKK
jgi:hypothetical protein